MKQWQILYKGRTGKKGLLSTGIKLLFLLIFFYDYETNNPLGSHKGKGKCGALYGVISILPPEYQSKLENNFLFMLLNTRERSIFTNKLVFSKVNDEINLLQTKRITISHPSGNKQICFVLRVIRGDNYGLLSLFGLNESFRSTFFCRFCLTKFENINSTFMATDCELRTIKNYNEHLAEMNPKKSGVKDDCTFNNIISFHFIDNFFVDVMHDVLEGIYRYDVALILRHLIYNLKLITLVELNQRIMSFSYGKSGNINKP